MRGDGGGGYLGVAGEHEDAEAGVAEGGDGLGGIGAEGVTGVEVADGLVVEGHPEAGDAGVGRGDFGRQGDEGLLKEGLVAEETLLAFDFGGESAAGKNLHVFGGFPGEAVLAGEIDDGVGEGVVGALFGCGGDAEEIVFRVTGEGMDGGEDGAADGEGAGFVEDDGVEVGEALERFPALEEDAELRAAADGDGERGGNGEAHGAGTGDDEDGDGVCEGEGKRMGER